MKRLQQLEPVKIEDLLLENNEKLMEQIDELIKWIIGDCQNLEEFEMVFGKNKGSVVYMQACKENLKEKQWRFLGLILKFCLNVIKFNMNEEGKQWECKLCGSIFQNNN